MKSLMRQAADGLFATAALFVIDIETGQVRYSSAGHPPAVICAETVWRFPPRPGVPLGTFAEPYEEQNTRLEPGEVLSPSRTASRRRVRQEAARTVRRRSSAGAA